MFNKKKNAVKDDITLTAYVKVPKCNRHAFKKLVGNTRWRMHEGVWAVNPEVLTTEVLDELMNLNCYIVT